MFLQLKNFHFTGALRADSMRGGFKHKAHLLRCTHSYPWYISAPEGNKFLRHCAKTSSLLSFLLCSPDNLSHIKTKHQGKGCSQRATCGLHLNLGRCSKHTTCNTKGGGSSLRCNKAALEFTCAHDSNHDSPPHVMPLYTDSACLISLWSISSINLREET